MAKNAVANQRLNALQRLSQIDPFCIGPKILQTIKSPGFLIEEMDDYGSIVQNDPFALVVAINIHAFIAKIVFQLVIDGFAHCMKLPATGARGDHKIVDPGGAS